MSKGTYNATVHCPQCGTEIPVEVEWFYDPGMRTLPNGDPGYPPTEDFGIFNPDGTALAACTHCGLQFDDVIWDKVVAEAAKQRPEEGPDTDEPFPGWMDGPNEPEYLRDPPEDMSGFTCDEFDAYERETKHMRPDQ